MDRGAGREKGFFRPGLMAEVWIVLPLHGGGVMDDLPPLRRRGVRRVFSWVRAGSGLQFRTFLRHRVSEQ